MTSYGMILKLCIGLWIASLFNVVTTVAAFAFTASFVIMDFMGFFRKDQEIIKQRLAERFGDPDEQQETRADEFKRKFEEGKRNVTPSVVAYTDNEGNFHKIIINADGRVDVEGNPDPKIVEAAEKVAEGVKIFGTEAIAEEFQRQIEIYQKEQKEREDD